MVAQKSPDAHVGTGDVLAAGHADLADLDGGGGAGAARRPSEVVHPPPPDRRMLRFPLAASLGFLAVLEAVSWIAFATQHG
jgi:hypothetical protein